jgi:hypothetical protein
VKPKDRVGKGSTRVGAKRKIWGKREKHLKPGGAMAARHSITDKI